MAKLVCLSGVNKGQEFPVNDDGETTMGRSDGNDICVFDKKSSRRHCKLEKRGDSMILRDLGSTNGIRLNNAFVDGSAPLKPGDHIKIGQTVFLVSDRPVLGHGEEEITISTETVSQTHENGRKRRFELTATSIIRKRTAGVTGSAAFFRVEE